MLQTAGGLTLSRSRRDIESAVPHVPRKRVYKAPPPAISGTALL